MQLIARGASDGDNLAIGSPDLIERELRTGGWPSPYPSFYPAPEGSPRLLDELRVGHPGRHVVVTNGAKQALLAAFYAYQQTGSKDVYHQAPYWPSYPTLARLAGLRFFSDETEMRNSAPSGEEWSYVRALTSPNNPDGRQSNYPCDIWDAVYASSIYGWDGVEPTATTIVSSLSKLLGLPGLRVGWLATKDPELARLAAQYVEITTSGVSTLAQEAAAAALRWVRENEAKALQRVEVIQALLATNGQAFNALIGPSCAIVRGVPRDGTGMFAWFKVWDDEAMVFKAALQRAKITLVSGAACGMTEPGWWRMNMALDTRTTRAALERLAKELP